MEFNKTAMIIMSEACFDWCWATEVTDAWEAHI